MISSISGIDAPLRLAVCQSVPAKGSKISPPLDGNVTIGGLSNGRGPYTVSRNGD